MYSGRMHHTRGNFGNFGIFSNFGNFGIEIPFCHYSYFIQRILVLSILLLLLNSMSGAQ